MDNLTTQQLSTLRTWLLANAANLSEQQAADALNATTTFVVWKNSVAINEIGEAFVGSEFAGLTTANTSRLQAFAQFLTSNIVRPSNANVRAVFDNVFSGAGGAGTRTALDALWRRNATLAESLLATGTGTTLSPATLSSNGQGLVTVDNVIDALR